MRGSASFWCPCPTGPCSPLDGGVGPVETSSKIVLIASSPSAPAITRNIRSRGIALALLFLDARIIRRRAVFLHPCRIVPTVVPHAGDSAADGQRFVTAETADSWTPARVDDAVRPITFFGVGSLFISIVVDGDCSLATPTGVRGRRHIDTGKSPAARCQNLLRSAIWDCDALGRGALKRAAVIGEELVSGAGRDAVGTVDTDEVRTVEGQHLFGDAGRHVAVLAGVTTPVLGEKLILAARRREGRAAAGVTRLLLGAMIEVAQMVSDARSSPTAWRSSVVNRRRIWSPRVASSRRYGSKCARRGIPLVMSEQAV